MSGYTVNRTRPDITSMGGVVTSMTMNFESTRVAIGSETINSNTGMVRVYDYNSALNTWVQVGTDLVGNGVNAYFGCSVDMDWDGDTLTVGARGSRTVHIYTYNGSFWVGTTVITKLSEADFGWMVSISKDTPNVIAASAPTGNNVYVYENITSVGWSEVFKTNGDSVSNFVPNDRNGNNYILKPFTNRYGESIRLSGFGDHLIVGQPGTVLNELNSTNTDIVPSGAEFPTSVDPTYVLVGNPPSYTYVSPTSPYPSRFGTNINRQVGSVSVFKTSGSWLTSNTQVGTTIYYDNVDNVQTDSARTTEQIAWSYPGFGLSVDISLEGDTIMVGAPLYSVLGGDYTYHNGQIVTYKINEGFEWVKIDAVVGLKSTKYGSSIKMDYTGKRAVVTGCNKNNSIMDVLDWNGTSWFETQPLIIQTISPPTSLVVENTSYITNGTIAGLSIYDGSTQFYDHQLTQSILGNNLVSGYLATEQLFVGANDNTNISTGKFSKSKKISFGGTYYDNTYEGATIENRVYREYELDVSSGQQGEGRSELLIAKTSEERIGAPVSTGSGGIDLIRLKATEIYLDSYSLYDGIKYEHKPLLALNYQKNVSIGLPFLDAPAAFYFRSNTNTKAKLDVNGSTYVRNRLNVNVDGGNDILGVTNGKGEPPLLLWDTRNGDSVNGSFITSNTMTNNREVNILGELISPVSYSSVERAFDLTDPGGGNVYAYVPTDTSYITVSLWSKLIALPTVDTLVYTRGQHLAVYVTSTGFKVHVGVSPSDVTYTYNYTFTLNKWVHIVSVYRLGTFSFYVNGSVVSPSSTTGTIPGSLINQTTQFTVYGGTGMFVGMVMVWGGYADRGPTPLMLYNNGPPSEMLKVGGDAVVTGKLGVGTSNPTNTLEVVGDSSFTGKVGIGTTLPQYPLDVTGDINFTGDLYNNGALVSFNNGGGDTSTIVRANHSQHIINGGGIVSFDSSANLKWSQRVILIPIERNEVGIDGYFNLDFPPVNTLIDYYNPSDVLTTREVSSSGLLIGHWEALWYRIEQGTGYETVNSRYVITNYLNYNWQPDENWILLAVRNGDNNILKFMPGQISIPLGNSYDSGTGMLTSPIVDNLTVNGKVGIGTTSPESALDVNGVLSLSGGTVASGTEPSVDDSNKTHTYIRFKEAGSGNDWAYLRQIGGDNAYHLALDFHDDGSDARFSIRDIRSSVITPDNIITRFMVDGSGNVAIGTDDPGAKLHVEGNALITDVLVLRGQKDNYDGNDRSPYWDYDGNVALALEPAADNGATAILFKSVGNVPSDFAYICYDEDYPEAGVSAGECGALILSSQNDGSGSSDHVRVKGRFVVEADTSSSDPTFAFQVKASNTTSDLFNVKRDGNVGIGTDNPLAKLHVVGASGSLTGESVWMNIYDGTSNFYSDAANFGTIGIYADTDIACGGYITTSKGTMSASDVRIKKNIIDVDDSTALDTLRILKPKKYEYKDFITRGDEPIWGFIAQEVNEVLPYATERREEVIPNIYEVANVISSNILTFTQFHTSQLSSNATTINIKCADNSERDVVIEEVVDAYSIRVSENLDSYTGSTGSQLFVYGQRINDFMFLKKDAIFTVATAALQEVDRQLQAEKAKVATLETQLASVLARLDALEATS